MKTLDILKLFVKKLVIFVLALSLVLGGAVLYTQNISAKNNSAYALSKVGSTGSEVK